MNNTHFNSCTPPPAEVVPVADDPKASVAGVEGSCAPVVVVLEAAAESRGGGTVGETTASA